MRKFSTDAEVLEGMDHMNKATDQCVGKKCSSPPIITPPTEKLLAIPLILAGTWKNMLQHQASLSDFSVPQFIAVTNGSLRGAPWQKAVFAEGGFTATRTLSRFTAGTTHTGGHGGRAVRLLASHLGEPCSILSRFTLAFCTWEWCRTMPLVGEFSRGSLISPDLLFRRCSILTSLTLTGSQDLAHKSRPNLLTHCYSNVQLQHFLLRGLCIYCNMGGHTLTTSESVRLVLTILLDKMRRVLPCGYGLRNGVCLFLCRAVVVAAGLPAATALALVVLSHRDVEGERHGNGREHVAVLLRLWQEVDHADGNRERSCEVRVEACRGVWIETRGYGRHNVVIRHRWHEKVLWARLYCRIVVVIVVVIIVVGRWRPDGP
ncbi:hypothetical protein PR048_032756 [Dryococelus australis]|uniref:Uncharacterized protein n=1 Tax=Dryococelus australis TaxID=614101 RepID=A0ABQ9G775_9NEOP|nr:hypothetical protein PR048_032756 [Dryococelus australis]